MRVAYSKRAKSPEKYNNSGKRLRTANQKPSLSLVCDKQEEQIIKKCADETSKLSEGKSAEQPSLAPGKDKPGESSEDISRLGKTEYDRSHGVTSEPDTVELSKAEQSPPQAKEHSPIKTSKPSSVEVVTSMNVDENDNNIAAPERISGDQSEHLLVRDSEKQHAIMTTKFGAAVIPGIRLSPADRSAAGNRGRWLVPIGGEISLQETTTRSREVASASSCLRCGDCSIM